MQAIERDYSMIDFVNDHGTEIECWDFLESFAVHIVSHKCKSFNNNSNHQNKMQMPTNKCIEGDGGVLLGYAQQNEQIKFIDYFDDTDNNTDLDIDIEDNKNMDRMFDLEIEETLASALDLLPEFCSIPIDDDRSGHDNNTNINIDQCLKMLKHINSNCNSQIYGTNGQREYKLINKISEMRDIIESLQYKLTNSNNQSREGFVFNPNYSENEDEDEDEGEDVYQVLKGNITLMGEGEITA